MNKTMIRTLLTAMVFLSACSPQPSPSVPASPTAAPHKSGTIRYSLTNAPSVRDVPSLMAFDALRAQGYTVDVISFAKVSLIPPALDKGDIDVADASTTYTWAAAAQGTDIRTVAGKINMSYLFVTTKDIDSCRDLDGKVIAFSSRQSVGYIMFERYVAKNCPGTTPDVLMISESSSRMAALQAGEVAGVYVELEDWLQLQQLAPDRFHVLIKFGQEFPQVRLQTYSMRQQWAQRNESMVKDMIRALLVAYRSVIHDPALLRDGIVKYLSLDAAEAQYLADVYLEAKVWDANGGLTTENLQGTLELFIEGGIVPAGSKMEDVADLSYLNAVLDEMGRE